MVWYGDYCERLAQSKVDPTMKVLSPSDYTISVSKLTFEEVAFLPLHDLPPSALFRVRVCAVDRLTAGGLPRYDGTITHFMVRVFLFHGAEVIPGSSGQTQLASGTAPRWMEWLESDPLRSLPRVTVALLSYGSLIYGCCAAGGARGIFVVWSRV